MLLLLSVFLTVWALCAHGQVKPCDFPEIKHGRLYEEGYYRPYFPAPIGKSYYYYCDENFEPPTETYWGQISCTREGWKPKLLCRRKCILDYLAHGQIQQWKRKYYQGETARVTCQSGYSLENGQSILTCTENDWVPPAKCLPVNSKGNCGIPLPIDNGDITSSLLPTYAPGSTVEYQCQNLYKLEGRATVRCSNGEWSKPPRCLEPCVISEDIMNKHNIQLRWIDRNKFYTQSGEPVEFSCKYRYRWISPEPLRTKCVEGRIAYPTCG
ncbi:complement factor H-related protein 2-like [Erinaceus europaeus]|uniref:Complement factor H-related protein 2-like n=1 Tax=Erinaceus europaeus TaxID=9365 RepID=A0A1S3W289_ERIEU|nr:complement factor H-related protein 2-like [Erinaceus europaeus]